MLSIANHQGNVNQNHNEKDFPGGPVDKNPPAQCKGHKFDPWSGKIPHAKGN